MSCTPFSTEITAVRKSGKIHIHKELASQWEQIDNKKINTDMSGGDKDLEGSKVRHGRKNEGLILHGAVKADLSDPVKSEPDRK